MKDDIVMLYNRRITFNISLFTASPLDMSNYIILKTRIIKTLKGCRHMKKTKKTKLSFKSILIRTSILAIVGYSVVSLVQLQVQISDKKKQLDDLNQQVEETRLNNAELDKLIGSGGSDEAIEKIARDRLGYAYPDEVIYKLR